MPFAAFHELFPDIAKEETRSMFLGKGGAGDPPAGEYTFIEMYCNEDDCDCRRAFFTVFSPQLQSVLAVIAWGWEDEAYYAEWLGMDDPEMVRDMRGPALNFGSPQSKYAGALLDLTARVLLADPAYVERIKRHYAMFRAKIDARGRPAKKKGRWKSFRKKRPKQ